jgi:hypothetical protein
MIELVDLRPTLDIGRGVLYVGSRAREESEPGLIRAWNGKVVYVQFDTRAWIDYPSPAGFICAALYPEHLVFAKRS